MNYFHNRKVIKNFERLVMILMLSKIFPLEKKKKKSGKM